MASSELGATGLKQQFDTFKHGDFSRHQLTETLLERVADLEGRLYRAQSDLDDQIELRANWKQRAEKLKDLQARSQFVLVLVDLDSPPSGYAFRSQYMNDRSGGAEAAQQLLSDVKTYVKENMEDMPAEYEVMVTLFANKRGLAKALTDAGHLSTEPELDGFISKFNQSQALFNFVDCGFGKESVDSKLRDTYRFFAYNSHCRYIFLACCHDNGYVAELKKFDYDPVVKPKTILVKAAVPAQGFTPLALPVATFEDSFEPKPVNIGKSTSTANGKIANSITTTKPAFIPSSYANIASPTTPSALPIRSAKPRSEASSDSGGVPATLQEIRPPLPNYPPSSDPHQIPINRQGQRIDRPMRRPTTQEQERYDARISYRRLCNAHHLRNSCRNDYCKYDHDPIDAELKHTLRYMARRIACNQGLTCRELDCYAGHRCPFPDCFNERCVFLKKGMHNVTDMTISKVVPAEDTPHKSTWY